jgi:hypothetical protein
MLRPDAAVAGFLGNGPTWGELMDLKNIGNGAERQKELMEIYRRIPLVRIEGGHVEFM